MRKSVLAVFAGVQALVVTGVWYWHHTRPETGGLLGGETPEQVLAWARLAGLLTVVSVLFQMMLVSRVRWVERAFGMDRLTRLHHVAGFAALTLLAAHPVLVTVGYARLANVGFWEQAVSFSREWRGLRAAAIGLLLFFAAGVPSVMVLMRHLAYERWYATHLVLYVAFGLTVLHQVTVGGDFMGHAGFRGYWYGLYAGVTLAMVGGRFGRPLAMFARHRFAVERIVSETADVSSVYLTGKNLSAFRAEAGQFVIVRFLAKGFRWEAHPFSLSLPVDGRSLRVTVKRLGDFTRRLSELRPGTPVMIEGPYGAFTRRAGKSPKALLIAGGIGVTPVRALAEDLLADGREAVLIYANRNRASLVFGDELENLAAASSGRLTFIPVMSDEPGWPGEKGHVGQALLRRVVPDAAFRDVFLCGPPGMMRDVRNALIALGVPAGRVHRERFML